METKYRIVERKYYDEYGVVKNWKYRIEKLKSFLFIPYWKTHCKRDFYDFRCPDVPLEFSTVADAKMFVKKLIEKTPTQTHQHIVVDTINPTKNLKKKTFWGKIGDKLEEARIQLVQQKCEHKHWNCDNQIRTIECKDCGKRAWIDDYVNLYDK